MTETVLAQRARESFFSSLKGELVDTRSWQTRAGAKRQ